VLAPAASVVLVAFVGFQGIQGLRQVGLWPENHRVTTEILIILKTFVYMMIIDL
jgi:hypothetical protein